MPRRLLLALLLLPLAGCTAGLATARLIDARRSVREAEEKGAESAAPYELAMARHHLRKAVEESGEAEYQMAMELADGAKAWAEQAVVITEGGRRGLQELKQDVEELEDIQEAPTPPPAPVVNPEAPPAPAEQPEEKPKDGLDDFLDDEDEGDDKAGGQ